MKESNKPGFLIFMDYEEILQMLTDQELGTLIRSIFSYEKTKNVPKLKKTIQMAFNFIKKDLDRGTEHYQNIVERNRQNGQKGGRPKNPNNPVGLMGYPKKPKKANINIKVNIKEKNIDNMSAKSYLSSWNETFGTNYTSTKQIDKPLKEWLTTYTIEQICEAVGNIKYDDYWKDKDLDPTWLLRFKDSSGDIDRIGKMLNTKKISKIVMNRIDTL